jgi:hypothetical protein
MTAAWVSEAWKDRFDAEWQGVVVTILLAVPVAGLVYYQRRRRQHGQSSPPSVNEPRGVSRLLLEPLPHDLVLKENKAATPRPAATRDAATRTTGTRVSSLHRRRTVPPATPPPSTAADFGNRVAAHPGLDAFWRWHQEEASLFRIYQLGRDARSGDNDDDSGILPLPRSSRRGQVQVGIRVQNKSSRRIVVQWINYKGHEQERGKLAPHRGRWEQQSFVEHPWLFRDATTHELLLTYTPESIIPTCDEQPTVDDQEPDVGLHCFTFVDATEESPNRIHIHDAIFPHPARDTLRTPFQAIAWCLLHMHRMDYEHWAVLTIYLKNILLDPARPQYRRLRLANATFGPAMWQTPARGLLLALGFVVQSAFVELGTAAPLGPDSVKLVSEALAGVEWRQRQALDGGNSHSQPAGADGFGRAGFGRAGSMK